MSSRHLSAIVLSVAMVVAPLGAQAVWAQAPAVTVASVQTLISNAARTAASDPTFAAKSNTDKLAAIQASIGGALASSGAPPETMADALIASVESGAISAGVAIAVAATVAPGFAKKVASSKVVQAQLAATGQSATVTASIDGGPSVSVLVDLQGAGGAAGAPAAAYDPCAGVIAAYCGG